MRRKKLSIRLITVFAVFAVTMLMTSTSVFAQTVKVLHDFNDNGRDGYDPQAGLIFDPAGNLYGTTTSGGSNYSYGTVFELSPKAGGGWSETILHSFSSDGEDGENPEDNVIFDAAGNLYGMTGGGGTYGYGTIFQLTPEVAGGWTEKILHSFNNNGSDGYFPYNTGLVLDGGGNLYGTTSRGGTDGGGTVFELTPAAGGTWTETVLHNFNMSNGDGFYPEAGLTLDSAGNLYGTTSEGGSAYPYGGTVFELTPTTGGNWAEEILHSFSIKDGWRPAERLIFDSLGDLYGSTQDLGQDGGGTVFELSPGVGGGWTERVLQAFNGTGSGGFYPSGLVFGSAGNLCGTASTGGADDSGVVFQVSAKKSGSEKILFNFNGRDGWGPIGGLIVDSQGNLYGTTSAGGSHGGGVVFEIRP